MEKTHMVEFEWNEEPCSGRKENLPATVAHRLEKEKDGKITKDLGYMTREKANKTIGVKKSNK